MCIAPCRSRSATPSKGSIFIPHTRQGLLLEIVPFYLKNAETGRGPTVEKDEGESCSPSMVRRQWRGKSRGTM